MPNRNESRPQAENEKKTVKKSYSAPKLKVHGKIGAITKSATTTNTDGYMMQAS